jgi:hypothetical protein
VDKGIAAREAHKLASFEVTTDNIRLRPSHIELRTAEDGAIVALYLSDRKENHC